MATEADSGGYRHVLSRRCGKGGNIFHFLMQKERIGFFDSVRMVAERVGYELPVEKNEQTEGRFKKRDMHDAMAFAVQFYVESLNNDSLGKKGRN